eukprot:SAG22_NODE_2784_length_2212_cov_2.925225_2_plen_62_part_00
MHRMRLRLACFSFDPAVLRQGDWAKEASNSTSESVAWARSAQKVRCKALPSLLLPRELCCV